jgi:hypothetical protein
VNADALAARLDSPAGFVAVMKGMFRAGKAKKAHAIWTSAQSRGIYETVELRFTTHESFGYAVLAFSDRGRIDLETQEILAVRAERVPIGTIRYESVMYSSLEPLGTRVSADRTVNAIAEPYEGVRVFTAVTSPKGAYRPLVAHCVVDGDDYVYPIPADRLR